MCTVVSQSRIGDEGERR